MGRGAIAVQRRFDGSRLSCCVRIRLLEFTWNRLSLFDGVDQRQQRVRQGFAQQFLGFEAHLGTSHDPTIRGSPRYEPAAIAGNSHADIEQCRLCAAHVLVTRLHAYMDASQEFTCHGNEMRAANTAHFEHDCVTCHRLRKRIRSNGVLSKPMLSKRVRPRRVQQRRPRDQDHGTEES